MLNNKIKSVQDLMIDLGLIAQKTLGCANTLLTHPSVYVFNHCCPVNFQTAEKSIPKPFRIGLRAFFFKKQAP